MTVIDVVILATTSAAVWVVVKHRNTLVQSNLILGSLMVGAGLLMKGVFYLADLFVMFGLPLLIPSTAVAAMEALQHKYSWIIMLVGTGFIFTGFALTNRRLFSLIDRLKRSEASLGRELTARTQAEEETKALTQVGRDLSRSLDPEEVAQRIVDSIRALLGAQSSVLFRVAPGSGDLAVLAVCGDAGPNLGRDVTLPRGRGVTELTARERRPVVTPNLLADPRITLTPNMRARIEQASYRAVLAVPLLVKDLVVGVLAIRDVLGRVFTDEEVQLAEAFADHAAVALENAWLFGESEAQRRAANALLEITRTLGSTLELRQLMNIIAQRTAQAVGAERCSINLWWQGHVVQVMSRFADGHTDPDLWAKLKAMGPYRLEEIPAHAEVIRTKLPVTIEDTANSSLLPAYWVEAFGIRSALVVPLVRQAEVIGTLNLDQTKGPYAWREDQIDLAMTIANQAALAVENACLYGETQRHLRETQSLLAVGQALGSTLELTEILRRMAREVARLLSADMVGAYMADPEGLALRPMAGYRVPAALVDSFRTFPIPLKDHPFVKEAWESKKPVFSSDAAADLRIDRETLGRFPHRSVLFVPVVVQDTPVGGLCAVWWEQERHFTPVETCFVEAIANQAAVAVVNARLYEEARAARDFLQSIAASSADAIVTTDVQGRVTYFSRGAEEILGYRSEEILHQSVADYYRSGLEEARRVMQRLRVERHVRSYETAVRAKHGGWVAVDSSFSPLCDATGTVVGTVGIMKDITERKRAEALKSGQNRVLELLATGSPLATVLVALVRTIEEQFHGIRCSVLLADEEGKRLRAGVAPSLPEEFTRAVDGLEIGPCAGSCGTAAYRREPVVVEDIASDRLWADFRELALGHGLRACWSSPILSSTGDQVLGTICLYYPETRGPRGAEKTLIRVQHELPGLPSSTSGQRRDCGTASRAIGFW